MREMGRKKKPGKKRRKENMGRTEKGTEKER
jgi:hypothetical protein